MESAEGLEVVLKVLHIGHTAECGEHARMGSYKAECPGGYGSVRVALLEPPCNVLGNGCKTSAKERLHYSDGDLKLVQLLVQVFSICVAGVCVAPVNVVHLNLDKVPVVLVVCLDELVKLLLPSVEGEAHIADASGFALLEQEVHHSVVHITLAESPVSATADAVHQVVVKVVRLQLIKGIEVHLL